MAGMTLLQKLLAQRGLYPLHPADRVRFAQRAKLGGSP
jgi:hypothetical protein